MPEFSLIIPVYNTQKYLAECLESCVNQTFSDIEIICVNDCSPDESYKILEEYAKKDKRIRIITHTKNLGLGGGRARNTGIQTANGEYSWFIDSDDSIARDACEILHQEIIKTSADIIRFNSITYKYDIGTGKIVYNKSNRDVTAWRYDILLMKKDYTKLGLSGTAVWGFIAKTALVKKVPFREYYNHEDVDWTPFFLSTAESIYCVNYFLYFYRQRKDSLTTGGKTSSHIANHILAMNALYKNIVENKIPKRHFCYRYFLDGVRSIRKDYKYCVEIHNSEYNAIIKLLCRPSLFFDAQFFYLKLRVARRIKRLLISFIEKQLK
jgi:glycosyltransferase involved in cell wall biosynthesis